MSDPAEPAVIYLEPDDEITTVVRRLRAADAGRVILVAPGRTKATTSAMSLRLLAGVAREEGRELVLVADPAARSLAGEAGIVATASVAEARALRDLAPVAGGKPSGARISVARGPRRAPPVPPAPRERAVPLTAPPAGSLDETRAVPVPVATPAVPRASRRTRRGIPAGLLAALALLLVGAVAAGAVLLPGATVRLAPATEPLGPFDYELVTGTDLELQTTAGEEPTSVSQPVTGIREDRIAATGVVVLQNWNTVAIAVGAGTEVAAGDIVFMTDARVVVPPGGLTPEGTIAPGTESVGVTAVAPGPAGNVPAEAIDTMRTEPTASLLRGFPNARLRVVINPDPTAGGLVEDVPVVAQADVDAALATLRSQLDAAVAAARQEGDARFYLEPVEGEIAVDVEIPADLVGREDETAFELPATLRWTLHWVDREEVERLARERLAADPRAALEGRELLLDEAMVEIGPPVREETAARIPVRVAAGTAPVVDPDAIRDLVAEQTPEDAEAALAHIGPASVDLWPGWVDRVPGLRWRISIEIESAIVAEPSASASAAR